MSTYILAAFGVLPYRYRRLITGEQTSRNVIANRAFFRGLSHDPPIRELILRGVSNFETDHAINFPRNDFTVIHTSISDRTVHAVTTNRDGFFMAEYLNNVVNAILKVRDNCIKVIQVEGFDIGPSECQAFARLLQDPECNITLFEVDGGSEGITIHEGDANALCQFSGCLRLRNVSITQSVTDLHLHQVIPVCSLKSLTIGGSTVNDGAIRFSLRLTSTIVTLSFDGQISISKVMWDALADALQESECKLKNLNFGIRTINDEGIVVLAAGLANNNTLEKIKFNRDDSAITKVGLDALAKELCDRSSINATYLSNHTLKSIGNPLTHHIPHLRLNWYLFLNTTGGTKTQIAMKKIVKYHRHFDVSPLFEWDLKMLPHTVSWFEVARSEISSSQWLHEVNLDGKKLDAIYQFVRFMPESVEPAPKGTKRKQAD